MENVGHQAGFDANYRRSALLDAIRRGDTDEHGLAYRSPVHRMMWWRTSKNIWDLLDPPAQGALLNIGVGFGFDEKVLHERFPRLDLWGIDISSVMIEGGLENGVPSKVAVANAEQLPYPAASFDRIVSREVIEHVEHIDAFLAEIVRVGKPGATVVITTPNASSWALAHLATRVKAEEALYGTHVFKDEDLPLQELDAAFERAGLIVERRFFDSVAWFWLSDLERTPLRGVSRRIGHRLQRLEGSDRVAALFCDQVKYRLRIPENAGTESAPEWRCPACQGELVSTGTGLRCDGCSASYGMLRGRAPIFFGSTASSAGDPIHTTILTRSAFRLAFAAHTLLYLPAMALSALIRR